MDELVILRHLQSERRRREPENVVNENFGTRRYTLQVDGTLVGRRSFGSNQNVSPVQLSPPLRPVWVVSSVRTVVLEIPGGFGLIDGRPGSTTVHFGFLLGRRRTDLRIGGV